MTFFSCDITDLKADRSSTEPNVTMKEVNGDYVCTAKLKIITGVTSDKSTFYAEFDQPVYNGEYEITIEKGPLATSAGIRTAPLAAATTRKLSGSL